MINQIIELCKGKHIYLQTHNFPDPDAIASAFGLQQLLKHFHIESTLCYEGKIDKISTSRMLLEFQIEIHSYEHIKNKMSPEDEIICVDSQKNAGNISDFIGQEVGCIDHHPTFVEVEYQLKYIEMVGACATLIAEFYKELGVIPSVNVATALLYGIKMDTSQFTRGVTKRDIDAYAYLYDYVDNEAITRLEHSSMEFRDLKAYGAAIEHVDVYGGFAYTVVPFACPDALLATLADFMLALDEVEVVVAVAEREDGIKISVRSEIQEVHAGIITNRVCRKYGNGGGHAFMAGGFIPRRNLELLGKYYGQRIKEAFIEEIKDTKCIKSAV